MDNKKEDLKKNSQRDKKTRKQSIWLPKKTHICSKNGCR